MRVPRLCTSVKMAGEMQVGGDPADIAKARRRAACTLRAILGFAVGCGLGAAYETAIGLRSLALPARPCAAHVFYRICGRARCVTALTSPRQADSRSLRYSPVA
jgi:hypothetical protein